LKAISLGSVSSAKLHFFCRALYCYSPGASRAKLLMETMWLCSCRLLMKLSLALSKLVIYRRASFLN